MSNLLLLGKDLPDSLEIAEALAKSGRKVFGTTKSEKDSVNFESENIFATNWNKASAVSAHSVIIKAETKLDDFNEVLFYFDTNYFCSKFELDKTEEVSSAVDTMINSYLYSTLELLKRIDQRKEKVTVFFLVREYPSKAEMISNKSTLSAPASTIVSAAQAAFVSLAENFATNMADRDFLSVILAKCGTGNEIYKNEKSIGDWISQTLDTIENQKNPQTVKQACQWNKAGSKLQSGFPFFK